MQTPHKFRFKSKIENISPIQKEILDLAGDLGFEEDALFCLRLALDEAMANAIMHGNKFDETKDVNVQVTTQPDEIVVAVCDEGCGFDQSCLKDPTQGENIQKPNGRGIFLIREFTKDVRFNEKGNQITFTIHRTTRYSMLQSKE